MVGRKIHWGPVWGGKDSASERYIFTQLNKITRTIFPANDDNVLNYLNDDGEMVEPIYYAPIVPVILINGSKGIGTGFSTDIMSYNPLQIIDYLNNKLKGISNDGVDDFMPYYEGFKGTISKITDAKFLIKGVYEKVGPDKIRVVELPVGHWTEDFKELLEGLIETKVDKDGKKNQQIVKDYDDLSKDTNVDFTITFMNGRLDELEGVVGENGCNGVEKMLKLYTTNTTTNMHLFDADDKLQKYNNVTEIIETYYGVRLNLYQERKNHMIIAFENELVLLSNKTKYIKEVLDGTIDLRKKKREEVTEMLAKKGFDKMDDDGDYKYLVKMPMDSVTEENVEKIMKDKAIKESELDKLKKTTINQMWLSELEKLKEQYIEYQEGRRRLCECLTVSKKSVKNASKPKTHIKKSK